jgi:hypothetical protein
MKLYHALWERAMERWDILELMTKHIQELLQTEQETVTPPTFHTPPSTRG